MRVVVAGGHGKIGQHLLRLLRDRGHDTASLDRNPAYADELRGLGAEPIACDLEQASEEELAAAVGAADAVVFSAGAGPGSGPERKWTMDHGGAVKLIAAAKQNGIRRYVMVSAVSADPDAPGDDTFAVYLRAKGKADEELRSSGLDFTIVRPVHLTDEPATGLVAAPSAANDTVPRADVAAVLAAVLDAPNTVGVTFDLSAGDESVEEAISTL